MTSSTRSIRHALATLIDAQGHPHLINPAHVVAIRPQGGLIGKEVVVEVCLSSGITVCAVGFGFDDHGACLNCATQLGLIVND